MNDDHIDHLLDRAAQAPHPVDPALLAGITASMAGASFGPVRPLPPAWKLASMLLLLTAAVASASAFALGLDGIHNLSAPEIGAIFPALGIFTWLAALLSVASMSPGGLRWKNSAVMEPLMANPARLLLAIMLAWLTVDAVLFRDYATALFIPQGVPCLRAGVAVAIPTGLLSWLILRRGFAVDRAAAGLAAGTLAGLAGLIMLELHCPNHQAPHIMVWHTAVIPVSALLGSLLARIAARRN